MADKVLIIRPDGTIEVGEGYTPTEAGEAFLKALADLGVTVVRTDIRATVQAVIDSLRTALDELQAAPRCA